MNSSSDLTRFRCPRRAFLKRTVQRFFLFMRSIETRISASSCTKQTLSSPCRFFVEHDVLSLSQLGSDKRSLMLWSFRAQMEQITSNRNSGRPTRQAYRDMFYPNTIWGKTLYYYFDPTASTSHLFTIFFKIFPFSHSLDASTL